MENKRDITHQGDAVVMQLIDDAIAFNGQGGVKTIPLIDGILMTNYVPFRQYFIDHLWTENMSNYVKSIFGELA